MFATEQDVRGVSQATKQVLSAIPGYVATAIMLPTREQLSASLEVTFSSREAQAQFYGLRGGLPKAEDDRIVKLLRSVPVITKVIAAPRA